MTRPRRTSRPGMLLCFLLLPATAAHAETDLEHRIKTQPMTHAGISGDEPVKVHWVQLQDWELSDIDNRAELARYHGAVERCLNSPRILGFTPNPPRQWPDRLFGAREDHYAAANYQITYFYSWRYVFDAGHCGLFENDRRTATLKSAAGQCRIDLQNKTAEGQCDTEAHRKAPASVRPPSSPASGVIPQASLEGMLPQALGITKTIAGLNCDVYSHVNRKLCATDLGSFQTLRLRPDRGFSLLLEDIGPVGKLRRAEQAQLDTQVDEAVFEPHLHGGFKYLGGETR